jgi:S-formylglutathione hydrolase FrmB
MHHSSWHGGVKLVSATRKKGLHCAPRGGKLCVIFSLTLGDGVMALFHAHFGSEALEMQVAADVILPERRRDLSRPLPCLWLLHGLSDDHTIWQRRTSIERYVAPLNLAVVMPAADRSWYADMAHGLKYWRYISEELPAVMRQYFPLSERRQDNFVAGLSMGGYGAFKLALSHPERYAAAASLSGAVDIASLWMAPDIHGLLEEVFGGSPAGTPNDLLHLAQQIAASGAPCPRLFQWCGTEDFLYQINLRFRDHAQRLKLPLDYSEGPGAHTWDRWDEQIQRVLAWLKLPPA